MATYQILGEIEDLARELGKPDPEYWANEKAGMSRSMNLTKKLSMERAIEILEDLQSEQ